MSNSHSSETEKSIFKLTIDDREIKSGIIQHIKNESCFDISVTRMPVADYCIDGNLWVERKTVTDLRGSIVDGRFFTQCHQLTKSQTNKCIILEGTYSELQNSQFNWHSIQGALIMVCVFWRIPLIRSRNIAETAKLLLILAKQNRQYHNPKAYQPIIYYKATSKHQSQLTLLCTLPGLGRRKSEALLEHFGSINNIFKASKNDLQKVVGIGPIIAQNVHNIIKEEAPQYL